MHSILVVKTSSFGDVIHMMPAVTDLRRARPDARVSWLIDEAYAPLARLHSGVDETIPVAWRRWRRRLAFPTVWREMRSFATDLGSRRFDAIVDTQGLVHSATMAMLARGPRHGYDAASVREPLASGLYNVCHPVGRDLHAIERNRRLLARALGYSFADPPDYGIATPRSGSARPEFRYALIIHATSRQKKLWPERSWVAVGNALARRGFTVVVPAGSVMEHRRALRIAGAVTAALAPPPLSIERIAGLLAGSSIVLGVDTGLLHLATALAVPTVAVFSGSNPALTGPVGEGAIATAGCGRGPPAVDEVMVAADALLARTTGRLPVVGAQNVGDRAKHAVFTDVRHPAVPHVGTVRPRALSTGG